MMIVCVEIWFSNCVKNLKNKIKSNEAKNQILSNPNQFLEYKRVKEKEMELLNTVPPSLTPYYKEKVNNYFNSVNK